MNNNFENINDSCANRATEALERNYDKQGGIINRLIVEGTLDRDFFWGLKNKYNLNLECNTVDFANKQEQNILLGQGYDFFESKNTRTNVINRVTSHHDEYGLVDKDFYDDICIDRIFNTDTHDLETLMLLKDEKLLSNVFEKEKIIIHPNVLEKAVKKAKYLAYQIGIVKKAIHIIPRLFIPNTLPLDYEKFTTEDDEVILEKFCNFVRNNCEKYRINEKDLINNEIINMFFNKYSGLGNVFNRGIDSILQTPDFWYIVNGHDICELLCFINEEIYKAFYKIHPKGFRIKIFESKIIDAFRKKYFKSTNLYIKMAIVKLLDY